MTSYRRKIERFFVLAGVLLATFSCATQAESATSLPTVVTGPPSAVTVTAATLTADVNPNGLSTRWFFEYGTSANYGLATASSSTGAVAFDEGVAFRVEG